MYFNPRTPCGVRHITLSYCFSLLENFNPRTPCGVRRPHLTNSHSGLFISIHAPRAGCDPEVGRTAWG